MHAFIPAVGSDPASVSTTSCGAGSFPATEEDASVECFDERLLVPNVEELSLSRPLLGCLIRLFLKDQEDAIEDRDELSDMSVCEVHIFKE